jgi:hypothetical protein
MEREMRNLIVRRVKKVKVRKGEERKEREKNKGA